MLFELALSEYLRVSLFSSFAQPLGGGRTHRREVVAYSPVLSLVLSADGQFADPNGLIKSPV
jgi:hypothetical protein